MSVFAFVAVSLLALAAFIGVASRQPRGLGLCLPLGLALLGVIAAALLVAAGPAPLPAVLALGLMPFACSLLVVFVLRRAELSRARWALLVGLGGLTGLVTGLPAAVLLS